MPAPSLIDYQEVDWSTTTASKDSSSISWQAGDVIIVIAGAASSNIPTLPTATGLTFTSHKSDATDCGVNVSAAVATSSGSSVVSSSVAGGDRWGFGVWVWRGSKGVGNSALANAQTVSLTPLEAHCAVCYGNFDFNAAALATITPTPSNTRERAVHGANYTVHVADLTDQSSAGAVSYGTTGGSGSYTSVAIEVRLGASVALTGTALASITEADIVAGGKTIIATVTDDTVVPTSSISDISFITFALSGTTDSTTLNITLPTVQADDIMVLEYTHRGSGTGTLCGVGGSGWTLKGSRTYSAGSFSGHCYYKRCDGSESGDALTVTGLTNSCAGCVTVYRGCVTSGDPIEAFSSEDNASGNETHAAITSLTDKAWIVLTVCGSPDVNVSTQSTTSPGALTERAERLNTTGTDTSISHASAVKASAGSTGSLTWAQTDGPSASFAYALKPNTTTPFDSARQAFINGFDSAQSEANGWDAEVKAKAAVTEVVRTSSTVVTWTIAAQAGYNITAQETITGIIAATMLTGGAAVTATPTFTVDPSGGGGGSSIVPIVDFQYRQRRA